MSYLQQLISNSVLITALIGWFAAQVLKMILVWDKKKFDFKRIIGSGEDFKTKNKSQKDLSVYDDNNINYDELEEIMRDKM